MAIGGFDFEWDRRKEGEIMKMSNISMVVYAIYLAALAIAFVFSLTQ